MLFYRVDFNKFSGQVWSTTSSRAELGIFSVPEGCNLDILCSLPKSCENVFKPGSYVFSIISKSYFPTLRHLFPQRPVEVFADSYNILYKSDRIPRCVIVDFIKHNGSITVTAKKVDDHPSAFHPKLGSHDNIPEAYAYANTLASDVRINLVWFSK